MPVFIGCAGWSVPSVMKEEFPHSGSHLQRYAAVFPAVEINTSFYRPHLPATYARWRDTVPPGFRFAVKVPKEITHALRLQNVDAALERFAGEVLQLREKLACLLVQLPPSMRYDGAVVEEFFRRMRSWIDVATVCEPRHPTWFAREAAAMLNGIDVAYVNADPEVAPLPPSAAAAMTVYIRLHGSPEMYHSAYSDVCLDQIAQRISRDARAGKQVWCVFDNTASGAAQPNALSLLKRLRALEVTAPPPLR
ncbi:DUF72 domain-containing protein [Noviherbaspirillum agri]